MGIYRCKPELKRYMKKLILGIVIVAVGAGVGLFVILRSRNSSPIPQNSAIPALEKTEAFTPSPSVAGQSVPAATNALVLSISTPADGATLTAAKLTVRGTTTPKADVFINELETRADAGGNFSGTLTLDEGENLIVIIVNDESGNVAEKDLTVFY